jgi:hypothetical protein
MTRHLDAVKTLCQAISGLLICRDILKKDASLGDVLLQEVMTHINMLGASGRLKIESLLDGALVILI